MNVEFWKNSKGNWPVMEFIRSIKNPKVRNKIVKSIELLKNLGYVKLLQTPYVKKFKSHPLSELIIDFGGEYYRILFEVNENKDIAILLHAFKKKTNKTPAKEINTALNRKKY